MLKRLNFQANLNEIARKTFGMTVQQAHTTQTCINCKETVNQGVNVFSDAGIQEYKISALCEVCYDTMYPEDKD